MIPDCGIQNQRKNLLIFYLKSQPPPLAATVTGGPILDDFGNTIRLLPTGIDAAPVGAMGRIQMRSRSTSRP